MDAAKLGERNSTTIQGLDTLELEIPEEMPQVTFVSPDLTFDSDTPSSTLTKGNTSLIRKSSAAEGGYYEPANTDAASVDEWPCEHPNCGRVFTHRHKLKYVCSTRKSFISIANFLTLRSRHRKYHLKLKKCFEPSCASRQVAFSLEKDLIRHQAKHNGCRF